MKCRMVPGKRSRNFVDKHIYAVRRGGMKMQQTRRNSSSGVRAYCGGNVGKQVLSSENAKRGNARNENYENSVETGKQNARYL